MAERAAVDRVEEGLAVLLVGNDENEILVPLKDLPQGTSAGTWLLVTLEGDRVKSAEIDAETTASRQSQMRKKLDRLLKRGDRNEN